MDRIRVAIVEDDPDWQGILQIYLKKAEDISIVWTASGKEQFLELAGETEADIYLMDINLTGSSLDGLQAALELREGGRVSGRIIMLTSIDEKDVIRQSFMAGAVHYVLKKDIAELADVIRSVHQGDTPREVLVKEFCRLKQEEQLKELTPAEREVFELLEEGLSRSEMEARLQKTENTLKAQIKNILRKLNVSNTKEAVRKVRSGGLFF